MKKRLTKVLLVVSVMFCISACGNKPSAETFSTETEESTIETTESEEETAEISESEETEPLQTASGHQHNIDVEEKMKETDAEEEDQGEEREEEVQTQTTATEKKETEVSTSAPEATTAPTPEPTTAPTTATAPSTPDMNQLEEWMPPKNMLVVCDANVVDENGNVLGPIEKGADIGVTGQCPGFYQVNYGAKRSFLPKDCLSNR